MDTDTGQGYTGMSSQEYQEASGDYCVHCGEDVELASQQVDCEECGENVHEGCLVPHVAEEHE